LPTEHFFPTLELSSRSPARRTLPTVHSFAASWPVTASDNSDDLDELNVAGGDGYDLVRLIDQGGGGDRCDTCDSKINTVDGE